MKLISLYGGPCCGKSTTAAKLFTLFKYNGFNVELVNEYVKQWAYTNKIPDGYDQFYIFMKQFRKEYSLFGLVDYIITDSPAIIGAFYNSISDDPEIECFDSILKTYYKKCKRDNVEHIHIFLKRSNHYSENGRFHSKEESTEIDSLMMKYLDLHGISYIILNDDEKEVEKYFKDTFL